MVLAQYGLSVECNERLDGEITEVGFACELALLPGFLFAVDIRATIIIDAHGDCDSKLLLY